VKKVLSLIVALGVVALFSGVTLAGADCSYHKTQAAVDKTDAAKDVATTPAPEKTAADQVQTAQANQPAAAKSAPAPKK
jgi:hypothetical protein